MLLPNKMWCLGVILVAFTCLVWIMLYCGRKPPDFCKRCNGCLLKNANRLFEVQLWRTVRSRTLISTWDITGLSSRHKAGVEALKGALYTVKQDGTKEGGCACTTERAWENIPVDFPILDTEKLQMHVCKKKKKSEGSRIKKNRLAYFNAAWPEGWLPAAVECFKGHVPPVLLL